LWCPFILSGVVEYAFDTVVRPLPVPSQIEFSKIMKPQQISRGLWNVGIGIAYLLLAVPGLLSKKMSLGMKWLLLFMGGIALLYILLGISSIIGGVNKL
jgi:hypothetical protein